MAESQYHTSRVFLGVKHMHDHGIVYRDLKPENILIDEAGRSKITDMGLACYVTNKLRGQCGTRGYMAPETLICDSKGHRRSYNHMVDWFSFGCLLFRFRTGYNPFRNTPQARGWHDAIREKKVSTSEPIPFSHAKVLHLNSSLQATHTHLAFHPPATHIAHVAFADHPGTMPRASSHMTPVASLQPQPSHDKPISRKSKSQTAALKDAKASSKSRRAQLAKVGRHTRLTLAAAPRRALSLMRPALALCD